MSNRVIALIIFTYRIDAGRNDDILWDGLLAEGRN
jgi:hypothetical protein